MNHRVHSILTFASLSCHVCQPSRSPLDHAPSKKPRPYTCRATRISVLSMDLWLVYNRERRYWTIQLVINPATTRSTWKQHRQVCPSVCTVLLVVLSSPPGCVVRFSPAVTPLYIQSIHNGYREYSKISLRGCAPRTLQ